MFEIERGRYDKLGLKATILIGLAIRVIGQSDVACANTEQSY